MLRIKTLWSENTLYIAAQLREPFVYGKVIGHNTPTPPYKVSVTILGEGRMERQRGREVVARREEMGDRGREGIVW